MAAKDVKFSGDARDRMLRGVDTLDHDTVMQRTKFGFRHRGSSWRFGFRSGCARKAACGCGLRENAFGRGLLAIVPSEC